MIIVTVNTQTEQAIVELRKDAELDELWESGHINNYNEAGEVEEEYKYFLPPTLEEMKKILEEETNWYIMEDDDGKIYLYGLNEIMGYIESENVDITNIITEE